MERGKEGDARQQLVAARGVELNKKDKLASGSYLYPLFFFFFLNSRLTLAGLM